MGCRFLEIDFNVNFTCNRCLDYVPDYRKIVKIKKCEILMICILLDKGRIIFVARKDNMTGFHIIVLNSFTLQAY